MNTYVMQVGHVSAPLALTHKPLLWGVSLCMALALFAGRRAFALQRSRLSP